MSKLQEAKTAIAELLENAKIGNIIPIRLPGQIEAIQTLIDEAEKEHADEVHALKNRPEGDAGDFVQETAEFIKTAVHDLKNPLASIKGYGDLLNNPSMAGELTSMQQQLLDVIRSNTKRMEGLLSDVGAMSKLRTGTLRANPKMDMFKNIAMLVEKTVKPIATELKRELEFDIPQGLPILMIDGAWLAEAMIKLIENGLRYSPEETGKVTVKAMSEDNKLIITIVDNGIGMNDRELATLGTLFWRSDHELVRSYKGSGLGVPIAYGLIHLLEGQISVDSTINMGTTFTLRFNGMS